MKISFLKKKKKKIILKPKKEINPQRDWAILVSIFLVLLLSVMLINVFILFTFTREIDSDPADFIDPTNLNKDKLIETIERYDLLEKEFESVPNTFDPIRDPA